VRRLDDRIYKYEMVVFNMKKKGQVAIFIILGIVIVSSVLVFFLWAQPVYFSDRAGNLGFEGCVKDVVEQGISELEGKAGFINPDFTYPYQGQEFTYLCYTEDYYVTCVVQVPFLKNVFDDQLERLIRDEVNVCYDSSIESLRDQGYSVVSGVVDYNVEIEPGVVRVEVDAPTGVGDVSLSRFNIRVNSPIYEMLMISTSIVQSEARFGDSDVSELMIYYPEYYIEKIKRGEGTTIYTLESKTFGNKFSFASRSLVWPAGFDLGGKV
jgi:hypothetical protein